MSKEDFVSEYGVGFEAMGKLETWGVLKNWVSFSAENSSIVVIRRRV